MSSDFTTDVPVDDAASHQRNMFIDKHDQATSDSVVTIDEVNLQPAHDNVPTETIIKTDPGLSGCNLNGLSLPLAAPATKPEPTADKGAHKRVFKVIVLGDSNVGKTCLTYRFCQGKFPQRTDATVGVDFREKTVQVGSDLVKLQIWDTAGQERFRKSMVPHYYRNVQAVIYVYDVTKLSSFENLSQWMSECEGYNMGRPLPSVVVGNKCDSAPNTITVTTNMAQRFADRHDMPLFETSARDEAKADHVESVFVTLIYKLMTSKSWSVPASPEDGALSPVGGSRLIEMKPRIEPRSERCAC